jgi:hypothetical protein
VLLSSCFRLIFYIRAEFFFLFGFALFLYLGRYMKINLILMHVSFRQLQKHHHSSRFCRRPCMADRSRSSPWCRRSLARLPLPWCPARQHTNDCLLRHISSSDGAWIIGEVARPAPECHLEFSTEQVTSTTTHM